MKKQTKERRPEIPTEEDWGDYRADLDQEWAHRYYCGKSNAEMQGHFRNNAIESASDLRFMPEVPFRYYILGYRDYVLSEHDRLERPDAANCFLGLVLEKLKEQPRYIVPIMPDLLPAVEYVANNQAAFDADEDIYGSFAAKLSEIKRLHDECKNRYRRL